MKKLIATIILSLTAVSASAATIGNDLINRNRADGWGNFNMIYTDLVLSEGTLTSWSAYGARSGIASLLVVSDAPGTGYNVEGVFDMNLTANTVTKTAINFDVQSGWYLGLYQGAGRVDFNYKNPRNINFSRNNSGQAVEDTFLSTPLTRSNGRDYSFSVELVPVPLPASFPLLGFALLGLATMARKRNAQT